MERLVLISIIYREVFLVTRRSPEIYWFLFYIHVWLWPLHTCMQGTVIILTPHCLLSFLCSSWPLFLVSPLHTAVFPFCMPVGLVQGICSCLQHLVISKRKYFTARLPSLWLSQSLHLLFCSAAGTWRWGHRCPVWGWALDSHLSSALWSAESQFWQSPAARRGWGLQESMGLSKYPQSRLTTCPIY